MASKPKPKTYVVRNARGVNPEIMPVIFTLAEDRETYARTWHEGDEIAEGDISPVAWESLTRKGLIITADEWAALQVEREEGS